MASSRAVINADGELVHPGSSQTTGVVVSSSSNNRGGSPRIDINRLDVFGFRLNWKQFLGLLVVLTLTGFGLRGILLFLGALGLYTTYNNNSSSNSNNISSSSSIGHRSPSRGSGGGGGGGPRIRGVKDLPKDPKRG